MNIQYYRRIIDKWTPIEPTKFNSKSKDDERIHVKINVDCEFQTSTNKPNIIITNQLDDCIYEHPDLGLNRIPAWTGLSAISHHLGLEAVQKTSKVDSSKHKIRVLVAHIWMFYAPTDIHSLFRDKLNKDLVMKDLRQDRRIRSDLDYGHPIYTGLLVKDKNGFERLLYIQVHDFSAIGGRASLKDYYKMIGMEEAVNTKVLVTDEEKSNMLYLYVNDHQRFVEYAKGDTNLDPIAEGFRSMYSQLSKDLDIPMIDLGYTVGTNTSSIITNILVKKLQSLSDKPETEMISGINKVIKHYKNRIRYDKKIHYIETYKDLMYSLGFEATYTYLWEQKEDTKQSLALVDGGRCKNERPIDVSSEGVLVDIDLTSCYGSGIRTQIYPIGLPTIIDVKNQYLENRMSLGQLLKSKIYTDYLVPGLWYARVSTVEDLSFSQDLIMSKIMPEGSKIDNINNSDDEDLENSKAYRGHFILLTREILNGALTHDILQALETCATNQEWKELKDKILIDSIMFYPKTFECLDMQEFKAKTISKDDGIKTILEDDCRVTLSDRRSRYWIGIPMGEGWMDTLLQLRKKYPKKTPQNELLKVNCNSTFGVIASHFFAINNVCVANNITARARVTAWLMSKALGNFQSITDGGIFNINTVNDWTKQPGLNSLTYVNEKFNQNKMIKETVKQIPLNNKIWSYEDAKENKVSIALYTWKHLKDRYPNGIDILDKDLFSLEVKDICDASAYQGQANYATWKEGTLVDVKARGYELRKDLYIDPFCEVKYTQDPPVKDALIKIREGRKIPPYPRLHRRAQLKINEFNAHRPKFEALNLQPGDTISRQTKFRPLSLTMFRWQRWEQYQTWTKKHEKLKRQYGIGVEMPWIGEEGELVYQEAVRAIQEDIDQGGLWTSRVVHKMLTDPYHDLAPTPENDEHPPTLEDDED